MSNTGAKPTDDASTRQPATADLGEVQLDLDRARRCGYPEAVFAPGKTVATLAKIFRRLLEAGEPVLATVTSRYVGPAIDIDRYKVISPGTGIGRVITNRWSGGEANESGRAPRVGRARGALTVDPERFRR